MARIRKNKVGFYSLRKTTCMIRKKKKVSCINIGILRSILQSSRSQPAIGVKQTPKARVSKFPSHLHTCVFLLAVKILM